MHKVVSAIGDPAVIYNIVPENVNEAKEGNTNIRKMLLNYDSLLNKFKGNPRPK